MSNEIRATLATLVCLAVLYSLPGCNRSDQLDIHPVHGKVTYRGKPVAGASVAFLAPGASRMAGGTTDESGNFQLTTFKPNDGAIVGTHEVTVKKYEREPPPLPQASANGEIDPAVEARFTAEMARWQKTASFAIPKKYTDRKTSDLRKEIQKGDNVVDIELRD